MTGGKRAAAAGDLDDLQGRLRYRFKDRSLLDLALTHRSHGPETGSPGRDNEALEFLGDAVLGFVVASRLFEDEGGRRKVGHLSRRRSGLVSEPALAALARSLGIGACLRLGKGEERSGGRDKDSLLADAFEAIVAAIYLDGGGRAARRFILDHLGERIAASGPAAEPDPKSRLQELLQARGIPSPEYRVAEATGPDHKRLFRVEVVVSGTGVAEGEGRSKKAASVEAARQALRRLPIILRGRRAGA